MSAKTETASASASSAVVVRRKPQEIDIDLKSAEAKHRNLRKLIDIDYVDLRAKQEEWDRLSGQLKSAAKGTNGAMSEILLRTLGPRPETTEDMRRNDDVSHSLSYLVKDLQDEKAQWPVSEFVAGFREEVLAKANMRLDLDKEAVLASPIQSADEHANYRKRLMDACGISFTPVPTPAQTS